MAVSTLVAVSAGAALAPAAPASSRRASIAVASSAPRIQLASVLSGSIARARRASRTASSVLALSSVERGNLGANLRRALIGQRGTLVGGQRLGQLSLRLEVPSPQELEVPCLG